LTSRRLASQPLVSRSHWLSPCAQSLRLAARAARLLVVRLHRLYCAYVVHPDAPSRRSTSRRSVALALTVRPVTASRGSTSPPLNLLSGRTGSTSATSCATCKMHSKAISLSRASYKARGNFSLPCAGARQRIFLRFYKIYKIYQINF
jgi:hypothetical protein